MSRRMRLTAFVAAGLAVAAALAFLVAPEASGEPDGLERVALDAGFADQADDHALRDSPAADYAVRGVDDERLSTGLSGIVGVAVTFLLTGGLFLVVRRGGRRPTTAGTAPSAPAGDGPADPAGDGPPGAHG